MPTPDRVVLGSLARVHAPAVEAVAYDPLVRPGATRQESYVTQGVEPLENSEWLRIAHDVLDGVKYSFASVAAQPDADVPRESMEADFRDALAAMSEPRRSRVTRTLGPLVTANQELRQRYFGRYGQVEADTVRADGLGLLAVRVGGLRGGWIDERSAKGLHGENGKGDVPDHLFGDASHHKSLEAGQAMR